MSTSQGQTAAGPTVYVVDEDPTARQAVVALVESNGVAALGYASAEEFLAAYRDDAPGCVVSDMRMSDMNGLELLESLRRSGRDLPVVLLAVNADVPMTVRAMKLGATTLLEKSCGDHDLWEAIRGGLERHLANRENRSAVREFKQRLALLTDDERLVMEYVVAGKPNKLIAQELDVSLRTIESRRHQVFEKLEVGSVAELVRLAVANNSDQRT